MKLARRDLAGLSLITLVFVLSSPSAAQRPAVGVEVQIKPGTNLYRNLYGKVALTQQTISEYFTELANKEFGFIEWKQLEKKTSDLAASLTIWITEEELKGLIDARISLEFEAKRLKAGSRFGCPTANDNPKEQHFGSLLGLKQTVYGPHDGQRPEELAYRAKSALDKALVGNADFRASFSKFFLNDIPLCREAEYTDDVFTLAVGRTDLRADEGSLMQLGLCAEPAGGDSGLFCLEAAPITFKGRQLKARFGQCEQPSWSCRFGKLSGKACEQRTPLFFKNRLKDSLRVFMHDYRPGFPHTDGSTSMDSQKKVAP